jgi:hypothetical protein
MSFLTSVLKAPFTAGAAAGKALLQPGNIGRSAAWGIAGGAAGYLSSDSENATHNFWDTIRGASIGAGASLLLGGGAALGKRVTRQHLQKGVVGATKGAIGLGRAGMAVGGFMMRHPIATAGIAGAALLATNPPGGSSPTLSGAQVNVRYDQQEIAAKNMQSSVSPMGMHGAAPQMMNSWHRAMQSSTAGLVQGLHQGRHSG